MFECNNVIEEGYDDKGERNDRFICLFETKILSDLIQQEKKIEQEKKHKKSTQQKIHIENQVFNSANDFYRSLSKKHKTY